MVVFLLASEFLNKQNCIHRVVCHRYATYIKILEMLSGGFLAGGNLTFCIVTVVTYTQKTLCVGSSGVMAFVIFSRGRKKEISLLENHQTEADLTIIPRGILDLRRILKTI